MVTKCCLNRNAFNFEGFFYFVLNDNVILFAFSYHFPTILYEKCCDDSRT